MNRAILEAHETTPAGGGLPEQGSFADFIRSLNGAHPIETHLKLQTVARNAGASAGRAVELVNDAGAKAAWGTTPQGDGLPLPHPIDFEWRFADHSAELALQLAIARTKPGDAILLYSVPSVALAALRSNHDRRFHVVGEDNSVTLCVNAMVAGDGRFVHSPLPRDYAAAAILDPPWYLDPFMSMLAAATKACRVGAALLLSVPPDGVRPGIVRELRRIVEIGRTWGLESVSVENAVLHYRSPAFEMSAMRAAGLGVWLPAWRRGDLLTLEKRAHGTPVAPPTNVIPSFELTVKGVRIRLLAKLQDSRSISSSSNSKSVFPSVSARAPNRGMGNVWTTSNRSFCVDPTLGLKAFLTIAMDRNLWPKGLDSDLSTSGNPTSIDAIHSLIHELNDLVDREFAETVSLVGAGAWETSVNDARFLNGSSNAFHAAQFGAGD